VKAPLARLLSYDKNVLRRSAGASNLGDLGVRKVAADQNERRRDVVKVTQVGYVLAATEHAEGSLEIDSRKQNKRDFGSLHNISKPEARENIVKTECSQIPNGHPSTSEYYSAAGKIVA